MVGHSGSAQALETAPIYGDVEHDGRDALVAVSSTATNPRATRTSEWVLRVCPTDVDGARTLAAFVADSLRARRVAVIYRNDLFGRGFTRAFSAELAGRDVEIIERDLDVEGLTRYEAYVERMARRRADAVVIAGGASAAGAIIRTMRRAGVDAPVLGTDDLAALQRDTTGAYDGVRYTAFYVAARDTTTAGRELAAEYQRRFSGALDHRVALSFDAATIIGEAVFAVGADRRRVRAHLATLGARGSAGHRGLTGVVRFDEWGDAVGKPVLVARVRQ